MLSPYSFRIPLAREIRNQGTGHKLRSTCGRCKSGRDARAPRLRCAYNPPSAPSRGNWVTAYLFPIGSGLQGIGMLSPYFCFISVSPSALYC